MKDEFKEYTREPWVRRLMLAIVVTALCFIVSIQRACCQPYKWLAPLTYVDTLSPFTLSEEWVELDSGEEVVGYWAGPTFYDINGIDCYQFFVDGYVRSDEWVPLVDTLFTGFMPKGTPPSLYEIKIAPLALGSEIDYLRLQHTSTVAKISALPLWFATGFAGGMGEGFLSKDGNWDTRSDRSHHWRDASIYLGVTAAALDGYALGIDIFALNNFRIKEWLPLALSGWFLHYAGTRVGYNHARYRE